MAPPPHHQLKVLRQLHRVKDHQVKQTALRRHQMVRKAHRLTRLLDHRRQTQRLPETRRVNLQDAVAYLVADSVWSNRH